MEEKIKKFEDEIKALFKNHSEEIKRTFWNFHLRPVIEISKEMARKYNADLEALWLAAILHDIARLNDEEPHDEIGAKKAVEILSTQGFSEELIRKVERIILTHRCKKYPPESLEEKILASADALSHFKAPFHLWYFRFSGKDIKGMLGKSAVKIERDFNEKIFFESEKESVRKEYEVLKGWFEYEV